MTDKEIDAICRQIRLDMHRKNNRAWVKSSDIERAIAKHFLELGQKTPPANPEAA